MLWILLRFKMPKFSTYLPPQVFATSKPLDQIKFIGQSLPHFDEIRISLTKALTHYASISPTQADFEEFYRVHDQEYLFKLLQMARGEKLKEFPKLSIECAGLEFSIPGYQYSLGGMFEAVHQMKSGTLERAYCFSMGGHHAYPDRGHGYCILNPLAATARYAQEQGFGKVLIIDWDYHHGDGTQTIFANDKSVYCISIHSVIDMYMSKQRVLQLGTTSAAEEVGHCNIPVLDKTFDDDFWKRFGLEGKYFRAGQIFTEFQERLEDLPWDPSIVFIFSGYDAHQEDCGRNVQDWVEEDFKQLTIFVLEMARKAECPILSVHGGGYNLPVTVSAAMAHINTLALYA